MRTKPEQDVEYITGKSLLESAIRFYQRPVTSIEITQWVGQVAGRRGKEKVRDNMAKVYHKGRIGKKRDKIVFYRPDKYIRPRFFVFQDWLEVDGELKFQYARVFKGATIRTR